MRYDILNLLYYKVIESGWIQMWVELYMEPPINIVTNVEGVTSPLNEIHMPKKL
jgi:hypothetical protein